MPTLTVPLANLDRQTLTTQLGPDLCRITVWSQPRDSWYCSVESPPNQKRISGRRMILNQPILPPTTTLAGQFYVRSLGGEARDPGDTPWGTTHALRYEY